MRGGDLSNEAPRKFYFVWEGLLALEPAKKRLNFPKASPTKVVAAYERNPWAFSQLWDLTYRFNKQFDVITYLGTKFEEPITEWCDRFSLGQGTVFASTVEEISHMAHAPFVEAIFDAHPSRRFTYGARGRSVDPLTFSWKG